MSANKTKQKLTKKNTKIKEHKKVKRSKNHERQSMAGRT